MTCNVALFAQRCNLDAQTVTRVAHGGRRGRAVAMPLPYESGQPIENIEITAPAAGGGNDWSFGWTGDYGDAVVHLPPGDFTFGIHGPLPQGSEGRPYRPELSLPPDREEIKVTAPRLKADPFELPLMTLNAVDALMGNINPFNLSKVPTGKDLYEQRYGTGKATLKSDKIEEGGGSLLRNKARGSDFPASEGIATGHRPYDDTGRQYHPKGKILESEDRLYKLERRYGGLTGEIAIKELQRIGIGGGLLTLQFAENVQRKMLYVPSDLTRAEIEAITASVLRKEVIDVGYVLAVLQLLKVNRILYATVVAALSMLILRLVRGEGLVEIDPDTGDFRWSPPEDFVPRRIVDAEGIKEIKSVKHGWDIEVLPWDRPGHRWVNPDPSDFPSPKRSPLPQDVWRDALDEAAQRHWDELEDAFGRPLNPRLPDVELQLNSVGDVIRIQVRMRDAFARTQENRSPRFRQGSNPEWTRRNNEEKTGGAAGYLALKHFVDKTYGTLSEFKEFMDVIKGAVIINGRAAHSWADVHAAIGSGMYQLDMDKLIWGVFYNEIQDRMYGELAGYEKKVFKETLGSSSWAMRYGLPTTWARRFGMPGAPIPSGSTVVRHMKRLTGGFGRW